MKIVIKEAGGKGVRLWMPSGLVCNRFAAPAISRWLQDEGVALSAEQLRLLFRQLRRYKARHPGWKLIEAQSSDGDCVQIIL